MHVGQLMGTLVLRRFVEDCHELIILIGDGTGMIGDPGGKSAERNLLDPEVVIKNGDALKAQFENLLGGIKVKAVVRNSVWLSELKYMEFLRDIGKHFTVNEMIKRDTVRPRIETPEQSISYTEFSYMLLQAYDYLQLHMQHACDLQVGGSDQWGNIISGVDLIRRKTGDQAFAFSWPLLVDKKTGKKFGKSEGNAVWLDPVKTTPFQFYQFWLNSDDEMVEELLTKMTLLSLEEITAVVKEHLKNPGDRMAQKRLAKEVTILVHGVEKAQSAEDVSNVLFGDGGVETLSSEGVALLQSAAPNCEVASGEDVADVLVKSNLASSKREAHQFLTDGAIKLNGEKIDETKKLSESDFRYNIAFLKRGKNHLCVLKLHD
jgi:tyrosyl-tRNA synthetase